MSKLEGRKVKLVMSTNKLLDVRKSLTVDLFAVGFVGTIIRVYEPECNMYPVVVVDSVGRSDIFRPEQLRYMNNKKVVL